MIPTDTPPTGPGDCVHPKESVASWMATSDVWKHLCNICNLRWSGFAEYGKMHQAPPAALARLGDSLAAAAQCRHPMGSVTWEETDGAEINYHCRNCDVKWVSTQKLWEEIKQPEAQRLKEMLEGGELEPDQAERAIDDMGVRLAGGQA